MNTVIFKDCSFGNQKKAAAVPLEQQDIRQHIGACLYMLPPKQLSRFLRDAFMVHVEDLVSECPKFQGFVSELAVLMIRLDAISEGNEPNCESNGQ